MTHAFFKALLFLGAGSVIHALSGEQDMRNMGGLRKKIRWTFLTMMCGAVAIAGIPPFSGFFSKDAILLAAHHHAPWMYWVGVVTAGMTAFYVFRAMFMTFFGDVPRPRASARIAAGDDRFRWRSWRSCRWPAASCSRSRSSWRPCSPPLEVEEDVVLMAISVAAGLIGIALAWVMYVAKPGMADSLAGSLQRPLHAGLQQVLRG